MRSSGNIFRIFLSGNREFSKKAAICGSSASSATANLQNESCPVVKERGKRFFLVNDKKIHFSLPLPENQR
jgi:hypothetical protein